MSLGKTVYDYAREIYRCPDEVIEKAKEYAHATGCMSYKALKDTAALNDDELLVILSKLYHFPYLKRISKAEIDQSLVEHFNIDTLVKLRILPLRLDKAFQAAIVHPNNSLEIDDYIKDVLGKNIRIEYFLITESEFNKHISVMKHTVLMEYQADDADDNEPSASDVYDITANDISIVVSAVNKIFAEATKINASDIHIEPCDGLARVRFRIDGILMETMTLPKRLYPRICNRIKTMAYMDVNTSRRPQSGRIRLRFDESEIDMRVSTLPTVHGEKITVRLLDNRSVNFDISIMDLNPTVEKAFLNIIEKPSGIVILTGPTGSGKSTSLYAVMSHLNDISRCIVTLEQPVEYRLPGLIQVPVDEGSGLSFDTVLREVLRQDPDTILIGEIRDAETARIAVQASNTGHQVFTTLHTNSAASSVMRLVEMGVEPFMVSSTINAVINQRLVRRICVNCKSECYLPHDSPFRKILGELKEKTKVFYGAGCDSCQGTGYKGRIAIQELLIVNEDIREALNKGANTQKLERIAVKNGMVTLAQDGIEKALAGLTTLDEVHRIIHFNNI